MTAVPEALFDRPIPARVGITLLNILLPGLGLIRLGHAVEGGLIAFGALAMVWLMAAMAFLLPTGSFAMGGLIYSWFLLVYLLALLLGFVRTWPKSRRDRSDRWWSRWYAIILWWGISIVSSAGSNTLFNRSYHSFYIASVSMEPTLIRNEKIVADMRWRTPQVGNIVMVRVPNGPPRIYRVAATGGQTFAMQAGVPIIDGQAATQKQIGQATASDEGLSREMGRVMLEHLPGEKGSHHILRLSGSPLDEVATLHIPSGSIFLLGDDRDLAADSRVSPDEVGVGILPASSIIGRPLYIAWSKDRSRIGQRADH